MYPQLLFLKKKTGKWSNILKDVIEENFTKIRKCRKNKMFQEKNDPHCYILEKLLNSKVKEKLIKTSDRNISAFNTCFESLLCVRPVLDFEESLQWTR